MMESTSLKNHLLVAMPNMQDPRFKQAVTLICEHNENGAVGININQPLGDMFLSDIFEQMDITVKNPKLLDTPLYFGGPLQQERGFVIHSTEGKWRSSIDAGDEICVTTSKDILDAIANDTGPIDVIVALGYAGWDADQLQAEIRENAWFVCPATRKIVFETPIHQRWEAAAASIGFDISSLSGDTGHA